MPYYRIMNRKGSSNIRLLLALSVIMLGVFGGVFWGLGIAFANSFLLWVGRLITASIPFVIAIVDRWIK